MSSGRTKIPDALHPTVLDLAGALHPTTRVRWTHAQIADWLRAEHDIAVCPRTVANLLRSLRQEVSHGLQDDARAALLSKLTAQVEAFDTEMDALLHDLHTTPKLKLGDRAEVLEVYRRALDTKLRWAGVGEKVTVEADVSVDATVAVTDARATLAAELAKLSAALSPTQRAELLRRLPEDVALALSRDWEVVLARDKQLPPPGSWRTWLILAGRGFGKTRTGAEWVLGLAREGRHRIIHLIGATAADVRDVMIEGPSGILTVAPPDNRPVYQPSKRRLVWPNGVIARTFSAEKPRQLRGPQCHAAWADELAAWQYEDAWAQLKLGLRLGNDPKVCVTTTPRPTKIIRALLAAPSTAITRGTTYENRTNLAEDFFSDIITEYEGTRLGRQELLAEVLTDTPGALWTLDLLDRNRVAEAPSLRRVAVAVDPAASSGEGSAETGIVGGGVGDNGHGYLLADRSRRGSPEEWGRAAVLLHDELEADFIVAESNQGGDMVASVIRAAAAELHRAGKRTSPHVVVKLVHASRGKHTRAEPVAQLDEQGRIHHVGAHATLEDQMTTWDAAAGQPSPDRMDARVWLFTALMVDKPVTTGTTHHAPPARPAFAPRR